MRSTNRPTRFLAFAVLVLAGCASPVTGPTLPDERPAFSQGYGGGNGPTIIELAADHSPFYNQSVSFWAKAGFSSQGEIYFKDDRGRRGERFARLRINSNSLLRYPDGRSFAAGDSVLITMRIADTSAVLFEMEPSGLQFRSKKMAELRIDYTEADFDFNKDGVVDALDLAIQQSLAIWMQEGSAPFEPVASTNLFQVEEIVAPIPGFSRFAIAY